MTPKSTPKDENWRMLLAIPAAVIAGAAIIVFLLSAYFLPRAEAEATHRELSRRIDAAAAPARWLCYQQGGKPRDCEPQP